MNRNGQGKVSMSNEPEGQGKTPKSSQWARLRQFVLSKPKGKKVRYTGDRQSNEIERDPARMTLRPGDSGFVHKHKGGRDNKTEVGSGPNSSRSLKKTRTFAGIFGRGKAKSSEEEAARESDQDFATMHPRLQTKSSSVGTDQQGPAEEENPTSISKSERLRWMKESNANRTMIFKGDLPPCSPLSTKRLASSETEMCNGSRRSDESEVETAKCRQRELDGANLVEKESTAQGDTVPEAESAPTSTSFSRAPLSLKQTLLNMRLGSIAIDDGGRASRLLSSPLASPRRMRRRTSSLPKYIGRAATRSTSAPEDGREGTQKAISNDYESPWGVKDTSETDGDGENRHSSKSFRVTEFVNGLKGWKPGHSSSDSLSLTDDEAPDGSESSQQVDMREDEFVDYSVKQILKTNKKKSTKNRSRRARQSISQLL